MTVEYNISRLQYQLDLYKLTYQDLLDLISEGLKKKIKREEIFSQEIKLNHLKRIDKIFDKGLSYYLDPQDLPKTNAASIFFRKQEFNSPLNFASRKIVNEFEDLKLSLSAIATLSDVDFKRKLPILNVKDNARANAHKLRNEMHPQFFKFQKDFLKSLINKLATYNILVFEFTETWNQTNKANIDGFFLNQNVIVLKRQQSTSFRREIFTLMHEFAHYLLNIEEVEIVEYESLAKHDLTTVEKWCNDFAFYFLIGEYETMFNNLPFADSSNDYNHDKIKEISTYTHLSELALFTRLLFNDKISYKSYNKYKIDTEEKIKLYNEEVRKKRELDEANGIKQRGSAKKPINSDLFISTIQAAFYEGVIDEYEVCKTLKISPEKIGNYIQ